MQISLRFDVFFAQMVRWRWVVFFCWVVLACAMISPALKFMDSTTMSFNPPSGTPSALADDVYKKAFPNSTDSNLLLVLVRRPGGVKNEFTINLTTALSGSVMSRSNPEKGKVSGVFGWANVEESGLGTLANMLVTSDGSATLILVEYSDFDDSTQWSARFRTNVKEWHESQASALAKSTIVEVVGSDTVNKDTLDKCMEDLETMDMIGVPLALVVLTYVVRSVPLMIIPLIVVGFSLVCSFGVMYFVATYWLKVLSFCPAVMMSLIIALSFDYSLFLLSRFREETLAYRLFGRIPKGSKLEKQENAGKEFNPESQKSSPRPSELDSPKSTSAIVSSSNTFVQKKIGNEVSTVSRSEGKSDAIFFRPEPLPADIYQEIIRVMLQNAGRIVATSGTVLFVCFISMCFLPAEFVVSFGLSAASTLIFMVATSLTFVPVVMLILRPLFSLDGLIPGVNTNILWQRALSCFGFDCKLTKKSVEDQPRSFFWKPFARFIIKTPIAVTLIVVISCCVTAVAIWIKDLSVSKEESYMIPHGAESKKVLDHLIHNTTFPAGITESYTVVMMPKDNAPVGVSPRGEISTVWTEEFFGRSSECLERLSKLGGMSYRGIISTTFLNGTKISLLSALDMMEDANVSSLAPTYQYFTSSMISGNASSAMMMTDFDPSMNISDFVKAARVVIDNCTARSNYSFYLQGSYASTEDSVKKVMDSFVTLIVVMFVVVGVLILGAYRLAVLPFRTILTIAETLLLAFGGAVIWFCKGLLKDDFHQSFDKLYWFTPIASFVIIVGLALDYDVFLFGRIFECWTDGDDTKMAIENAMDSVSKVVCSAGVIMCIAFGTLMSSKIMTLNQIGFILFLAVLFDTFVLCTLFVSPAVSLLGPLNWWPRRGCKCGGFEQLQPDGVSLTEKGTRETVL